MKQKFTLKTILTVFAAFSLFASSVNAQGTAASATWSLLVDTLPTTSGAIMAVGQKYGPLLRGVDYGNTYGGVSGWQRLGRTSSVISTSDSAFRFGSYVEYAVTPKADSIFRISSVSASVIGGGTGTARLAAVWSLNNFVTTDSLGSGTYNGVATRATRLDSVVLLNSSTASFTGQQILNFPSFSVNVNPGDTFKLRFYVWLTGYSANNRNFNEQNVVIGGTTVPRTVTPVTFASAKAFQRNSGVSVEWTSATEVNVSKYLIEKSTDGTTYREVGTVAATGTGTTAKSYSWYDATPSQGNNFYRIKAVDRDGSAKYTSVLKVALGRGAASVVVSPNPVRGGVLNLQLNNLDRGTYVMQLLNSAGQKVFTSQLVHQGGSASETMQIPALQKGLYNLQLVNGATRISKSVVVE